MLELLEFRLIVQTADKPGHYHVTVDLSKGKNFVSIPKLGYFSLKNAKPSQSKRRTLTCFLKIEM